MDVRIPENDPFFCWGKRPVEGGRGKVPIGGEIDIIFKLADRKSSRWCDRNLSRFIGEEEQRFPEAWIWLAENWSGLLHGKIPVSFSGIQFLVGKAIPMDDPTRLVVGFMEGYWIGGMNFTFSGWGPEMVSSYVGGRQNLLLFVTLRGGQRVHEKWSQTLIIGRKDLGDGSIAISVNAEEQSNSPEVQISLMGKVGPDRDDCARITNEVGLLWILDRNVIWNWGMEGALASRCWMGSQLSRKQGLYYAEQGTACDYIGLETVCQDRRSLLDRNVDGRLGVVIFCYMMFFNNIYQKLILMTI